MTAWGRIARAKGSLFWPHDERRKLERKKVLDESAPGVGLREDFRRSSSGRWTFVHASELQATKIPATMVFD
jgi:hypothetical protein